MFDAFACPPDMFVAVSLILFKLLYIQVSHVTYNGSKLLFHIHLCISVHGSCQAHQVLNSSGSFCASWVVQAMQGFSIHPIQQRKWHSSYLASFLFHGFAYLHVCFFGRSTKQIGPQVEALVLTMRSRPCSGIELPPLETVCSGKNYRSHHPMGFVVSLGENGGWDNPHVVDTPKYHSENASRPHAVANVK